MAKRIRELWGQQVKDSATLQFIFIDFDSAIEVDTRIRAFGTSSGSNVEVPYSFGLLPIKLPAQISEAGGGVWFVTVEYGTSNGPEVGTGSQQPPDHGDGSSEIWPEIGWSMSSGTQHIKQSLKTRDSKHRDPSLTPRNFGQAIGVNDKGEVEGCDKLTAEVRWSLMVKVPQALMTGALLRAVETRAACMNLDTYYGYEPGELLMTASDAGHDGSPGPSGGSWNLKLEFAVHRNQAVIDVSDEIQFFDVKGWDYIWCTYETVTVNVGGDNLVVTRPKEAYVEQIYQEINFAIIPTRPRRTRL